MEANEPSASQDNQGDEKDEAARSYAEKHGISLRDAKALLRAPLIENPVNWDERLKICRPAEPHPPT